MRLRSISTTPWLQSGTHGLAAALLSGITLVGASGAWAAERYEGLAYSTTDGGLSYREVHWRYRQHGRPARLVVYHCANGEPFARKHLVDSGRPGAPDFDFLDARDGYREGVRKAGDLREVYWQASGDRAMKTAMLEPTANAVIDAGFDSLVRARWQALQRGTAVSAAFLLPSRLDFIDVSIDKVESANEPDGTTRLRMELDAWYGFAAPKTELVYRNSDRQLLRFEGVGTIRDKQGRHQQVRIEFPPGLHRNNIDRGQVDAAAATPLVHNCEG
ncbi:hypothetical protein [Lysobacter sp. F6437]|uniref:hypothetical protein n=1 Tax=Lysobacter sp. F6437 TaxID=3459296 RepID=UPI00403DB110